MSKSNEKLAAKVRAINCANAHATDLYPELRKVFEPLVGKQVVKKDGGLLEKIKKLLPEFPCKPLLHVYRSTSIYSLAFTVKTCVSGEGYCYYHETTVYVGYLRDGVLTELSQPFSARSDYTVEEALQKRARLEAARKEFEDSRSDVYPFGEND